jgi:integrase
VSRMQPLGMEINSFVEILFPQLLITAKTLKNYTGAYNCHLILEIGGMELEDVTKNQLVNLLAVLPAQTRYQTLMVARVIFREAMERDLISENPAKTIKPPRIDVKPGKFLTWEELSVIDFGKQTARIQFLALHGCRYGEAVALLDTDIYDGLVHISKSAAGETKTVAGNRVVPLLSPFPGFAKSQKRLATLLKPFGVTVHSLRKTYAYTLKSSQIHVTTAAKMMGHSNPLVTLKIYTLVLDDEIAKSASAIEAFMVKSSLDIQAKKFAS